MQQVVQELNGFQRMMLRWEDFHPVNAAHMVELGGGFDATRVGMVVRSVCQSLGLGAVRICPRRRSVRLLADHSDKIDESLEFQVRQLADHSYESISAALDVELNRPFASGTHCPIRVLYLESKGLFPLLVLVYRHAIADARGVSLVLREIVRALHGTPPVLRTLRLTYPQPREIAAAPTDWRNAATVVGETLRELWASLRSHRPALNRTVRREIVSGIQTVAVPTALVKNFARRCGGTVGDLAFAAMFEGLSLLLHEELRGSGRRGLGLCAPVDLRQHTTAPLGDVMGQLLGSMTVRDGSQISTRFSDRLRRVAAATKELKRKQSFLGHATQMNIMSTLWDLAPRWLNRVCSPTLIPLAGCLSNVNFSELFQAEFAQGMVRAYYRFSGTGILVPLMASLTTLGPVLNLTTSHHSDAFDRADVNRLMTHVRLRMTGDLPEVVSLDEFRNREPDLPLVRKADAPHRERAA